MAVRGQLLQLLADGHFYSGASLGRTLGISRSAIWKHIRVLRARQIDIHAVPGRGYRLVRPLELLSRPAIIEMMGLESAARLTRLDILTEVDSTNRYLLSRARHGGVAGDACLAEYQSAGRGRQGRHWVSPFAANIYLSLLWRFPCGAEGLGGLGLAVGVSVLRAIQALGAKQLRLKWPNDLVYQDKKLAGVLIEMSSDASGGCYVVIGIGLNVRMPRMAAESVDQAWTDLEYVLKSNVQYQPQSLSRNRVAASILQHLLVDIAQFQLQGLRPFLDDWHRFDNLLDRSVTLASAEGLVRGVARGIDAQGALRIEHQGRIQRYLAGDVSVRVNG